MAKMGTVWDRTAEFLSDNIAAIVPVALLTFFVPASIQGNFAALTVGGSTELRIGLTLVQLAFAIVSVWGSMILCAMALEMGDSRNAGAVARRRLLPMLAVSVALFVLALLLLVPLPLAFAASGVDVMALANGTAVSIPGGVAAFAVLYYILLVVLFFWAAARLIVLTPVVLRENRSFGAIGQSWRLTRGHTLRIVGVLLLFAIVAIVANLAATTVFGSIFALIAGIDAEGLSLAGVLTSIVQALVQTGFMVIAPIFTAKLYLALVAETGLRQGAVAA